MLCENIRLWRHRCKPQYSYICTDAHVRQHSWLRKEAQKAICDRGKTSISEGTEDLMHCCVKIHISCAQQYEDTDQKSNGFCNRKEDNL